MTPAAGAYDKFSDATRVVGNTARILGRESLVDVLVTVQDHIGVVLVERVPQRCDVKVVPVIRSGVEARVMPVGERACFRTRREIGSQPLLLRRPGRAQYYPATEIRVENDDVPVAQIVTVITLRRIPSRRPEITEVSRCARRAVLVVSRARHRSRFVTSP